MASSKQPIGVADEHPVAVAIPSRKLLTSFEMLLLCPIYIGRGLLVLGRDGVQALDWESAVRPAAVSGFC